MPFDGLGLHPEQRPRHGLSLCSGGGGLDLGLQLAEPGFHSRCLVEWDEYPQKQLIAAQRAGYMAPAPIWDDVTTFDGRPWRGLVDTILAGYPCQPFSAAGKRQGEADERHLWPDVARIIREVRPRWVFLENVAGHITLGLETVLRELREMGFDVAAQPFSAEEIGAPHERLRIFIVAYSKDNCRWLYQRQWQSRARATDPAGPCGEMAHSPSRRWGKRRTAENARRGRHADGGQQAMAISGSAGTGDRREQINEQGWNTLDGRTEGLRSDNRAVRPDQPVTAGPDLANAEGSDRRGELEPGSTLANDHGPRASTWGSEPKRRQQGIATQLVNYRGSLFPPGPADQAAWDAVIRSAPDLAPALSRRGVIQATAFYFSALLATNSSAGGEPGSGSVEETDQLSAMAGETPEALVRRALESSVRGISHGMAERTRALKLLGNGVCPLAAANAWRNLARDLGLAPFDMGTANH